MTLRVSADRRYVRWAEEDVVQMAAVVGPDYAVKGWAPYNVGLLRAAKRRGVFLSTRAERDLQRARRQRTVLRAIRRQEDATDAQRAALEKRYGERVADLFPHQRVALWYLDHGLPAYLLADEPGVGKTAPAILWAARKRGRKLVVTPNAAKEQWARAIDRWDGGPVVVLEGRVEDQRLLAATPRGWVVAHWEALVHAAAGLLARSWTTAILDEVHRMRNRKTQRAETAFKLDARYRLALSGHPYVNAPDELFATLKFLYPETYTSFWRYAYAHVKLVPKAFGGHDVLGARRPKLLRWELAAFTIRRTKRRVWPTLPPVTRVPRYLELGKTARREYEKLRKQFFVRLETVDGERVLPIASVLARTTRVRQYLVDPGLLGAAQPSVKYPAVLELIEDLGAPVVVFTSFRQAARRLGAFLARAKRRTALIAGRQSAKRRGEAREAFLRGDLDALLVVMQAGGEALNLGRYGYVAYLDLPWTAKDVEQTEGRVDRPEEGTGVLVPTTAYRLIVRDTYEEQIVKTIEEKHRMFAEVFSPNELKELFA